MSEKEYAMICHPNSYVDGKLMIAHHHPLGLGDPGGSLGLLMAPATPGSPTSSSKRMVWHGHPVRTVNASSASPPAMACCEKRCVAECQGISSVSPAHSFKIRHNLPHFSFSFYSRIFCVTLFPLKFKRCCVSGIPPDTSHKPWRSLSQ